MMSRILIIFYVFLLLPIPIGAASERGSCEKVFAIAASAMSNKAKGINKEKMASVLPPLNSASESEPLRSMHEILDEVYGYEINDQYVYSIYRGELCVRRNEGKSVPKQFSEAYKKLESCAKEGEDTKTECAMKAAGS